MPDLDKETVESILKTLDETSRLFPQFELQKVNNQLHILGRGGFSTVYEMFNKGRPEKHYALKVIGFDRHVVTSKEFNDTSRLQMILCQESQYIVRILDTRELVVFLDGSGNIRETKETADERWEEDGLLLQFVLMEKMEDILSRDKFKHAILHREELNQEEHVIRMAFQIGQALELAHKYEILHRDIKLENIFWDEKEKVYKLGDFGIARQIQGGAAETIVYTDGYGAPEIERRLNDHYSYTADIYSFGITLYLLLNDLKFPGSDGYYPKSEVQYNPEFIFPAPKHASAEMTRVIRRMCSYRAEERYQSVTEVLKDLALISQERQMDVSFFFPESEDMETETYREDKKEKSEQSDDSGENTKTRAQRLQEQKIVNAIYKEACIRYYVVLSVLFVLLLKGQQPDISNAGSWSFWIFPGVILFSCILIGTPVLQAAGATGMGLWLVLEVTGNLHFLQWVKQYNLGWIVLVIIILTVSRLVHVQKKLEKESG